MAECRQSGQTADGASRVEALCRLFENLEPARDIFIVPHVRADGDAVGSALSLGLMLDGIGHKVQVWLDEPVNESLQFLPKSELLRVAEAETGLPAHGDVLIMVDCHERSRIGRRGPLIDRTDLHIVIDHHRQDESHRCENHPFSDFCWIQHQRSSTCEMIGLLLMHMYEVNCLSLRENLPAETLHRIAELMVTGIYSDTGSLQYSGVGADTYRVMAFLTQFEPNVPYLSEQMFSNISMGRFRLIGHVFSTAKFYENESIVVGVIEQEDYRRLGAVDDDSEGICSQMREVKGVDMAVLLRHVNEHEIRVNLRSSDAVDVSCVARNLGGGGHRKAAGMTLYDCTSEEAVKTILDAKNNCLLD